MSADMMLICKEDHSDYKGNPRLAFFLDETSMGEPHHEFGVWFQARYCRAPGILEQIYGVSEHDYTIFTESDLVAVQDALERMACHPRLDKAKLLEFLRTHVDRHISTENW